MEVTGLELTSLEAGDSRVPTLAGVSVELPGPEMANLA
jgi:hypothetical protein